MVRTQASISGSGGGSGLPSVADTPGFRFTVDVQRSWCAARCTKAAWLALSILPPAQRDDLISSWVKLGGGTASFVASESDAFLEFIAERLNDPSHELTICRMEQATLRASEGARSFLTPPAPEIQKPGIALRVSPYATLVQFHAEPQLLLESLDLNPLPPLSEKSIYVLFAPGLELLSSLATDEEVRLMRRLAQPIAYAQLAAEEYRSETIERLFVLGAIDQDHVDQP